MLRYKGLISQMTPDFYLVWNLKPAPLRFKLETRGICCYLLHHKVNLEQIKREEFWKTFFTYCSYPAVLQRVWETILLKRCSVCNATSYDPWSWLKEKPIKKYEVTYEIYNKTNFKWAYMFRRRLGQVWIFYSYVHMFIAPNETLTLAWGKKRSFQFFRVNRLLWTPEEALLWKIAIKTESLVNVN